MSDWQLNLTLHLPTCIDPLQLLCKYIVTDKSICAVGCFSLLTQASCKKFCGGTVVDDFPVNTQGSAGILWWLNDARIFSVVQSNIDICNDIVKTTVSYYTDRTFRRDATSIKVQPDVAIKFVLVGTNN